MPIQIPPPELLHKVNGNTDPNHFTMVAERFVTNVEDALDRAERPLGSMGRVLDFGCGCGRPIQWLTPKYPGVEFSGCDADQVAVEWCAKHLEGAGFRTIRPFPPTSYPDDHFDLVMMISVFTHIAADHQLSWLPEIQRILAPGGTFLFTVHGESVWRKRLKQDDIIAMERDGFKFCPGGMWKNVFPDWYGTSFHSERWIRENMEPTFRMLDYRQKALNDHHDIAVMTR